MPPRLKPDANKAHNQMPTKPTRVYPSFDMHLVCDVQLPGVAYSDAVTAFIKAKPGGCACLEGKPCMVQLLMCTGDCE